MSELQPRDTHVLIPSEVRRLSGQTALLFARLCQGPATNRELAQLSLKYTSRISDLRVYLRPLGQTVKLLEEDHRTGRTVYGIIEIDRLF